MHYLYFVVVHAEDSASAREAARDNLDDEKFVSDGGYFGGGKSDWYIIGGRWSGVLTAPYYKFHEAVRTLPWAKSKDNCLSDDDIKQHTDELETLWESLGGKGTHPYGRDTYAEEGYDDDAMPLTKELLARLKKEHPGGKRGGVEVFVAGDATEMRLAKLDEKFADGKRWIVVVDYHN